MAKSHSIEKRKRNFLQNLEFREENENFVFKILTIENISRNEHSILQLEIEKNGPFPLKIFSRSRISSMPASKFKCNPQIHPVWEESRTKLEHWANEATGSDLGAALTTVWHQKGDVLLFLNTQVNIWPQHLTNYHLYSSQLWLAGNKMFSKVFNRIFPRVFPLFNSLISTCTHWIGELAPGTG